MSITPLRELAWETCDDLQSQVFSLEEINAGLRTELNILRAKDFSEVMENIYDEDAEDKWEAEDWKYERSLD